MLFRSLYLVEMLVFLDETGTDNRDTLRRKAYSIRGKPSKKQTLLVRSEHVSALCLMSIEGILACKTVRGSVDGERFGDFIENSLMVNIMPLQSEKYSHHGQLYNSPHK